MSSAEEARLAALRAAGRTAAPKTPAPASKAPREVGERPKIVEYACPGRFAMGEGKRTSDMRVRGIATSLTYKVIWILTLPEDPDGTQFHVRPCNCGPPKPGEELLCLKVRR